MGLFGRVRKGDGWLAIDIGADGYYAVCVSRVAAGKPVVVLSVFQAADSLATADALARFGKPLRASQRRCTTLLGHGQYQMLSVDAPDVPANERKEAVRWRLKDLIDFPVDQATIDLLDAPLDKTAVARKHTMLAVVARNDVIAQRQDLFSAAKIGLSVIDIPDMAQRNISVLLESEGRGLAMLSFDASGGLLTVTYAGELYLSRRIEVSIDQLMSDDAQTNCFDRITLELQRSLDHCDRQYHFIVVAKLVLAPIDVPALQAHLAGNLYIPVEMLDLADIVDLSQAPVLLAAQQRFFMCLGAALRQEPGEP
jgi:MSHA biogenesis protein MshI